MGTLKNKVAVVTGGNSGIGFATAKEFLAQGATVIITGRSQSAIEEALQLLGPTATGIRADAANVSDTEALVEQVKARFGRVDVLFVNAGVFYVEPIGQITEATFDTMMGINFKGAVFTVEKFLPLLSEGASIITLSSISAYAVATNTAIYAASKAALNAYTRTAATELAPRKIRVNAVTPGPIATNIMAKTGLPEEALQGMASVIENRIPLKRIGQPAEVAKLVAFLASDDASFITGVEYNIDGGVNVNVPFG